METLKHVKGQASTQKRKKKKNKSLSKTKAYYIPTKENRAYVFTGKLCIICEMDEKKQITRVIRNALSREVTDIPHLNRKRKSIQLDKPLHMYALGLWEIELHNELYLILRRQDRTIKITIDPSEEYRKKVSIMDVKGGTIFVPGKKGMHALYTLEKYLEAVDSDRVLGDTHPHHEYREKKKAAA